MSKIANAFNDGTAFIGFLTAGDPTVEKTVEYILAMEEAGCDLIEIGIPFSDPMAEGVVIQDANVRALKHDTTTDDVFEIVKEVRHGIISPDLPYEEKGEIADIAAENDVDVISLIAPTSKQRIQKIAADATGFIYVVSSLGVTGMRSEIKTDLNAIISDIRDVTDLPLAVGFGINTPEQATEISKIADGVIVGSAIVKIIEKYGENATDALKEYVADMKNACLK